MPKSDVMFFPSERGVEVHKRTRKYGPEYERIFRTTCKDHPTYKAVHPPRSTSKNPGGCSVCWEIYRRKHGLSGV